MTSCGMDKNQTKKQSDREALAEVTKEMAKPRAAMSAREKIHVLRNDLVVKEN